MAGGATIAAQIEVDASAAIASVTQANKSFDQLTDRLKSCDDTLKRMEKSMGAGADGLQKQASSVKQADSSWVKMAATMYTVRNAAHMVTGALTSVYEAAAEGAKIGAAQQFFENAGKSIEEYRKATRGMVSDSELMKKANLADSMGIDEATFKKLVLVAEASALKTGQSFDLMFNSIIVGTARSSRLLLDNLGIIISVGQANENYAKKVLSVGGATEVTTAQVNSFVEAMTAEQKQLAFVDEVARKSTGTLDEYAKVTDKSSENFSRLSAEAGNFADMLKIKLSQALSSSASGFAVFLNDLTSILKGSGFWTAWYAMFDPDFRKAQAALNKNIEGNKKDTANNDAIIKGTDAFEQVQVQAKYLGMSVADTLQVFKEFGSTGDRLVDGFAKDLIGAMGVSKLVENYFKDLLGAASDLAPKAVAATAAKKSGGKAKVDPEIGFLADMKEREYDERVDALKMEADAAAALLAAALDWEAFGKEQRKKWSGIDYDMAKATKELDAAAAILKKDAKAKADAQFNSDVGNVATAALSGGGGAAVGNILGGAAAGAVGGPFGAVIGALVAALGGLLDSLQPLMTLVNDIVGGLGLLLSNALTPLFDALLPLGPALVAVLGAFGMIVRVALEPFVQLIKMIIVPLSMLLSLFAAWGAIMAVGIQLLSALGSALFFITGGTGLGAAFDRFDDWLNGGVQAVADFTNGLLSAVAGINNGIVYFIRRIPGMEGFGSWMTAAQFKLPPPEPDPGADDNGDALDENTAALRDLQREFRNLPSSYKANGVIFGSTTAERGGFRQPPRGTINARWRT